MTKRIFLFFALALAVVAGVGWFALSSGNEPEEAHSGDPAPVEPQLSNEGEAEPAVRPRDIDREDAPGTDYLAFTKNDLKLQPGELDEFLSFDVNNPQRWAVACDLTEDPGLLEEALSRFPDDKGLLTRLLVNDFASGDVESTAQRMLKSHPDQSIADYALAARALKSGDSETAFRHLVDALTKEPPVLLTSDEVLLRRAALESTGLSPTAAGLAAFKPEYDQKSFSLMMSAADLVNRQDSGDTAFAELGVGLSEHMRQAGAMNFGNEIMALAFQRAFLEKVDPEAEFGDTGLTVAQQLEEVKRQERANAQVIAGVSGFLETATDDHIAIWANKALSSGPLEAFRYMQGIRERSDPPLR